MSFGQSKCAALFLGLFAGFAPSACNEDACTPGADGCPCDANEACAVGLVCIQGWCQADHVGATATDSTDPSTSSSESAGTTTVGEPSTSDATTTTTDSHTNTTDTDTDTNTTGPATPTPPSYVGHALIEPGEARDVAVTPSGELAIVGFVERAEFDRDAWLGVFSGIDQLLWERTFNGEDGHADEFNGVAVDGSGRVTATGRNDLLVGWDDVLTMTWDAQGTELHMRGYGNEFHRDDVGLGVAVDDVGNVYVCGFLTYMDNFDGNQLAYTKRYADVSGSDWFNYNGLLEDSQFDCETGPSGYLVTIGRRGSFTSIHRFAADGDTVYRHEYAFPDAKSTVPFGLAIDPDDEAIYVAGYASGFPGTKPWVGKWDWAGDKVWIAELAMEGDRADAQDLVLDAQGWLRVVGSDHVNGEWAVVITTLGPDGVEHDRLVWTPPEDEVRALGVATREDALYVVGGSSDRHDDASKVLVAEFSL